MGKVKNQHYVPRCYLRRFAQNDKHVYVFDKQTRNSFQSSINGIAAGKYFYDLPQEAVGPDGDVQATEKWLSMVEADLSKTVSGLLDTVRSLSPITDAQRHLMAFFMAVQFFRTMERRLLIEDLRNDQALFIKKAMIRMGRSVDEIEAAIKQDELVCLEETAAQVHAKTLMNPTLLRNTTTILERHIWMIGVNDTKHLFYTSDHPVVKRSHLSHIPLVGDGLGSPGIEIAFPLDPRHVIVMYERSIFKDAASLDGAIFQTTQDNVEYYNSLQVAQCHRQVYSSTDAFCLARRICLESPGIANPDRKRTRILGHPWVYEDDA